MKTRRPHNALRREIQDALSPVVAPALPSGSSTFRIVLYTQCMENYGYRWKAKGGREIHLAPALSVQELVGLGPKGVAALVDSTLPKAVECNDHWMEYVLDWELVGSNERTYYEQVKHEDGYDLGIDIIPIT